MVAAAVTNSLTIKEKTGSAQTSYPVQIGRPFVQGEIPSYPQAVVGGTPVATQADVKSRWQDGSVKHAILSFLVPSLGANATVTVTFQNQTGCNCGSGARLSKTDMLSAAYDFQAQMVFTGGISATVSARTILNDWNGSSNSQTGPVWYWIEGSIATTVILADHTTARAYDVGSDANKSLRPIFHATFWPTVNKVRVRFIGEVSNTQVFQDQSYDVTLKTGYTTPTTVFTKAGVTHYAGTRWTKEYWIGGAPAETEINHNLAYLVSTKFIPNFDQTKVVSESKIASEYSSWTSAAKNLYDAGNWDKAMPNAGGRPDIGIYPSWVVRWLFTFDNRMREQSFGNADLAGAWGLHYREGNSAKCMDRDTPCTTPGIGHILSTSTRPTIRLWDLGYGPTAPADRITVVGPVTTGGWTPDVAHQPEIFSALYTLSGDFWYLEQLWFWVSWSNAESDGAANTASWGRGPSGAEGGIAFLQLR